MAAAGDHEAMLNLIAYRVRHGLLKDMPVDQLVLLRRAVVDALPSEVRNLEQIGDLARWNQSPDRDGWFPAWEDNMTCPRGHRDDEPNQFWITDGNVVEYPTYLNRHGAFLDYDAEDLTGHVVAVACGVCHARWPLTGREGVSWTSNKFAGDDWLV
jgi:hypothetical protein